MSVNENADISFAEKSAFSPKIKAEKQYCDKIEEKYFKDKLNDQKKRGR